MMKHNLEQLFSPSDRDRIASAIAQAEGGTSGEIVPYVALQSDDYSEGVWRAACIGAAVTLAALGIWSALSAGSFPFGIPAVAAIVLAAGLGIALLVGTIPALRRACAGGTVLSHRVTQRAVEAFVAEEVFNTEERLGILIFLSLFEHRVVILGDSGINSVIAQHEWDAIIAMIVKNIRAGRPVDGLVEAIEQCGEFLRLRGILLHPEDTNELPDQLRIHKR